MPLGQCTAAIEPRPAHSDCGMQTLGPEQAVSSKSKFQTRVFPLLFPNIPYFAGSLF